MEGNVHSIAGETIHQTRPEGRKDKMHTSQTGGYLAHRRLQKARETKQEASFDALADAMFGGQNAPRGRCKGNFCTAEDRELEAVGTRAGSMLQKVKRSKHYEWGQLSGYWAANKEHILPANFPSENHMCWAEGPLCRRGEAQKIAEGAWQRNESNLHTAEDGTRMHGRAQLRSIPGKTQMPGEFIRAAGHQKNALEPSYGWHCCALPPTFRTLGELLQTDNLQHIYCWGSLLRLSVFSK